jgi:RimJ/RimL family protein N-acetyltransferase
LGLRRVVAIATLDNESSARLLEKLGLRFEKMVRLPNDPVELRLFAVDLDPSAPGEGRPGAGA